LTSPCPGARVVLSKALGIAQGKRRILARFSADGFESRFLHVQFARLKRKLRTRNPTRLVGLETGRGGQNPSAKRKPGKSSAEGIDPVEISGRYS
jgi:hypothetical protein